MTQDTVDTIALPEAVGPAFGDYLDRLVSAAVRQHRGYCVAWNRHPETLTTDDYDTIGSATVRHLRRDRHRAPAADATAPAARSE